MILAILKVIMVGTIYGAMIALPIGPGNIELLRRGLREGFEAGMKVGLGVGLSDALLCLVVYFGIAKLFLGSKVITFFLWIICSIIMINLGISGFKSVFSKNKEDIMQKLNYSGSKRDPVLMGFMINTSNPMVLGFWIVFLGTVQSSFIKVYGGIWYFTLGVLAGSLLWFYILSHIIHKGKKYINNSVFELISFLCASIFTGFGLVLVYNVLKTIFLFLFY